MTAPARTMTLTDRAAKLPLRVESEPHGAGITQPYAASALPGLIAARTNLDIQQEIETAWRYADGMETAAARRALLARADQNSPRLQGDHLGQGRFPLCVRRGDRGRPRAGHRVLQPRPAPDRRSTRHLRPRLAALEKPGCGRGELSPTFAEVCRFTFQPQQAEPS